MVFVEILDGTAPTTKVTLLVIGGFVTPKIVVIKVRGKLAQVALFATTVI